MGVATILEYVCKNLFLTVNTEKKEKLGDFAKKARKIS
jgi:hypothetical protein